jgi:hypothetical protein
MIQFPRKWRLFDFVDTRGRSIVKEWAKNQDDAMKARVNQRLDILERHGPSFGAGILAGTRHKHIDKLKVYGKGVTWRIMICKGPISNEFEFTILYIAQEKDRKLIPKDADKRADQNRTEIIANPERRCEHERLS